MNKREFIRTVGASALGVAAGTMPSEGAPARPPGQTPEERAMNWIWITPDLAASADEWKRRFAHLRAHHIHAILPEIYDGRRAYYRSSFLPTGGDWLETILPLAKAEGLEVHAWTHCMPCNIPEIAEQHREWFVVNGRGESCLDSPAYVDYYRFTCPNRPGSREFLERRIAEMASIEGLDGIHFDYIRFPDVIIAEALQSKYGIIQDREYPEYDYCYCDVCRNACEERYGFDPMSLPDPAVSPEWREFRYESITILVNDRLIPLVRRGGKKTSAATFPNWEAVRQRWHHWDLDYVLPMLYHNFYHAGANWVRDHTRSGIDRLREQGKPTQLFSGLFVGAVAPSGLTRLIEKSYEGGAKGVVLFSYRQMNDRMWDAFVEATSAA